MRTAYEQVLSYLNAPNRFSQSREFKKVKEIDMLGVEFNSQTLVSSIDQLVPQSFDMPQHVPLSELEDNQIYQITVEDIPRETKYIWKTNNNSLFFSSAKPTKKDIKFLTYQQGNSLVVGPNKSLSQVNSQKVKFQLHDTTMAMYLVKQ